VEAGSGRSVYGVGVGRLEAFTVLTLGNVNGVGEGFSNVNLDVSVGEFSARCGSSRASRLVDVMLVMDTGTVVTFFFTCITDLFFTVVVMSFMGNLSSDVDGRRVMTFPSGFAGLFDLNLLVSLGGCGGLHFAVPVGRREDAEGDRDAGFKVQVCDFC
jgi:hypothetical protein